MVVGEVKRCGFRRRFENLAALCPPPSPLVLEKAASLIAVDVWIDPHYHPHAPPHLVQSVNETRHDPVERLGSVPGSFGLGAGGVFGRQVVDDDGEDGV
jgi:hypothetical protein